jgi:[ribosomal protein S5]-alanine N-acetyltransferase
MPLPAIELVVSPRTTLREVQASDLTDLMEVNGDPEVTQFLPYATWQSLEDASAWLERMRTLVATGTARQLVIVCNANQKVIGTALLFKFEEASNRLELGYVLGRAYWKQGYAAEALRALLAHVFAVMQVRRVEAEVNPNNIASNALLRSLGFSHEGYLRERWVAKGATYGVNIYGLLASEWAFSRPCPK